MSVSVLSASPDGWGESFQTVMMGSSTHGLVFEEPTSSVFVKVRSRNLFVDANGMGENLTMPLAELSPGGPFYIINISSGGESIGITDFVFNRGTLEEGEIGMVVSDGGSWHVTMVGGST